MERGACYLGSVHMYTDILEKNILSTWPFYKISQSTRECKNNSKRSNKCAGPVGGNKVYVSIMSNAREKYFEHA